MAGCGPRLKPSVASLLQDCKVTSILDQSLQGVSACRRDFRSAEATIDGTRKETMELFVSVPLLIIDDLGMRKLPMTAAEDLLEIVMRRYERASTLLTSNRPVDDWGKLLGDSAAVTAMLDRLLHHGHVLKMRSTELALRK
jgi:DNA replication protein DnaC